MDSRAAIEQHAQAINRRDLDAYRESMAFAFTYQNYNGVAFTIEGATRCGVDSRLPREVIVQTDSSWSYTGIDSTEAEAQSESSAVFKIGVRRVDQTGTASSELDARWIATRSTLKWRVRFRHNLWDTQIVVSDAAVLYTSTLLVNT